MHHQFHLLIGVKVKENEMCALSSGVNGSLSKFIKGQEGYYSDSKHRIIALYGKNLKS